MPPLPYAQAEPGLGRHISFIRHFRQYSPDPSTKVASLILDETGEPLVAGVNTFPRGVAEAMPEVFERPLKYDANTHSERGAIYNAARQGIRLQGCTICVTATPCVACTTAIIESGIKTVIIDRAGDTPDFLSRWADKTETGLRMFKAAGIEVKVADVDGDGKVRGMQSLDEYLDGTIRPAANALRAKAAAPAAAPAAPARA